MLHEAHTQTNESLNMRAAELAPKFKNYSRTTSLNFRINIVIGHHNMGFTAFYTELFRNLGISLDSCLADWLQSRDARRSKRIVLHASAKYKRERKFKWKAKSQREVLLERARDAKTGTYKSGTAMEGKKDNPKRSRKRKAMNPCACGGAQKHFYRNSKHCLLPKVTKKVTTTNNT